MGFNILGAIAGAAQGFAMGGPGGAVAGGAVGGFSGGSTSPISATGDVANAGLSAGYSGILAQQNAMNMQMAQFQLGMQKQSNDFNMMIDEQSELHREGNALREVSMEQRKSDISITKEFIKSIA